MIVQKHRIVLIGLQGSGKTTLLNQLTGSKEKTKFGGAPVTNQLFLKGSQYGAGFDVLDTPGFGVSKKKFEHSACLVAALIEGPISQICVVVQGKRTDLILEDLERLIIYCSDQKQLLTAVVTHMDIFEDRKVSEKEIEEEIKQYKINSVMFLSKNDQAKQVCEKFDNMLLKTKQKQLTYPFYEIHKRFDAIDLSFKQKELIGKHREDIKNQFYTIAGKYLKFIKNQKKQPGIVDIMHNLILHITQRALNLVKSFQEQYGKELNNQYDTNGFNLQYLHDIILKREIWGILQQIIDNAQLKMKEYGGHCYNFLRECPHCGEVWLKVEGCDGEVCCGNFPEMQKDALIYEDQGPIRITFNETADCVEIDNYQGGLGFFGKIGKALSYIFQNRGANRSVGGCGKKFVWKDATPMNEETIKEVLNPELANFFSNSNFNQAELQANQLEKAFNETFKLQVQKSMQEMKKQ